LTTWTRRKNDCEEHQRLSTDSHMAKEPDPEILGYERRNADGYRGRWMGSRSDAFYRVHAATLTVLIAGSCSFFYYLRGRSRPFRDYLNMELWEKLCNFNGLALVTTLVLLVPVLANRIRCPWWYWCVVGLHTSIALVMESVAIAG